MVANAASLVGGSKPLTLAHPDDPAAYPPSTGQQPQDEPKGNPFEDDDVPF